METLHDYAVRVRRMSGRELMNEACQITHMIDELDQRCEWDPALGLEWDIVRNEISIRN
jgi:hypothetical protein